MEKQNSKKKIITKKKLMDKTEKRKKYLKKYRQEYKKTHKKVTITLTNQEYKYFKALSKKEGIKQAELIRKLALSNSENIFISNDLKESMDSFVFLIRNIANNINQIARHSNTIKKLVEENDLLMWLKKLEDSVKKYIKTQVKKEKEL